MQVQVVELYSFQFMMVNVSNFQTKVPQQQKQNTTKQKNDDQTSDQTPNCKERAK
jgi:hypothetical protein